jgi:hypothetical protein
MLRHRRRIFRISTYNQHPVGAYSLIFQYPRSLLAISIWRWALAALLLAGDASLVERLHEKHPVVMKHAARLKMTTSNR